MAKKKAPETAIRITGGKFKDDFCHYNYEITEGIGTGDTIKRDGKGLIKEDLRDALAALNPHLSMIDDSFKTAKIEVKDINDITSEVLATNYTVTSFQIVGSDEDLHVILTGNKYISCSASRMEIKTPKIPLDGASSYKFATDLKEKVETLCMEVELYKNGKYDEVEKNEEDENQTKLFVPSNEEDPGDDEFGDDKTTKRKKRSKGVLDGENYTVTVK